MTMSTSEVKRGVLWLTAIGVELAQEKLTDVELLVQPVTPISISDSDWQQVTVIVVDHEQRITLELMQRCPKLRVVVRLGIGVDNIDQQAASQLGVCVCNVPDYGIEEVADAAMAQILALFRQTTLLHQDVLAGEHFTLDKIVSKANKSRRIRGKTLGLLGLGNIGIAVSYRAKVFGFQVIFHDPYVHPGLAKSLGGVEQVSSVDELISRSDCVSLHCPLTTGTQAIINKATLSLFKKDAFLINTARGGLIDEPALAQALKEGKIAGAALDVFSNEPFTMKNSVFEGLDNVLLTPHSAWYSMESQRELLLSVCKTVQYALSHNDQSGLTSCLNRSSLDLMACKKRWM